MSRVEWRSEVLFPSTAIHPTSTICRSPKCSTLLATSFLHYGCSNAKQVNLPKLQLNYLRHYLPPECVSYELAREAYARRLCAHAGWFQATTMAETSAYCVCMTILFRELLAHRNTESCEVVSRGRRMRQKSAHRRVYKFIIMVSSFIYPLTSSTPGSTVALLSRYNVWAEKWGLRRDDSGVVGAKGEEEVFAKLPRHPSANALAGAQPFSNEKNGFLFYSTFRVFHPLHSTSASSGFIFQSSAIPAAPWICQVTLDAFQRFYTLIPLEWGTDLRLSGEWSLGELAT